MHPNTNIIISINEHLISSNVPIIIKSSCLNKKMEIILINCLPWYIYDNI